MMNLDELDALSKRIAEEAALLSPQEGDALIRSRTKEFPEGIRALLLAQSSNLAEQARTSEAVLAATVASNDLMYENLNDQRDQIGENKFVEQLRKHGFYAGLLGFAVSLALVFCMAPLSTPQWWVVRVLMCMSGAMVSTVFCGFLNVKGQLGVLAISASGGFAIFIVTYFFNPPSLPPIEMTASPAGVVGGK